ncbi:MAG: LCP family protein [Lutispora sp.]|nr:LCP family protein [Lutispora sp.]MDD4834106.1 LCP family protein [Lutispora sp.]
MFDYMRKIALIFIISLSLPLIACSSTNVNKINTNALESNKQESIENSEIIQEEKSAQNNIDSLIKTTPKEVNKNILIVGIDARRDENARADTMILVNMRSDKINLISVPRDTLIKINGKGTQKINASYAYGGIELCKTSVEKLLDTKIDNYLVFNFKAIQKGVDALGGFTVTIPKTIKIRDPELKKCFTLKKGDLKLNGIQTLEYLRYRSDGRGDIGRIYRQQEFIKDLQDSFLKLENVPLIPKAYLAIRDEIKTDMDASHMASYFISGYRLRNNFDYHTLKGYGKFIDKVSYYVLYKNSIIEIKEILK